MQDSCRLLESLWMKRAGVCVGVDTPPTHSVGSLHASPAVRVDCARATLDKIATSNNWSTRESKVIYADSMAGLPRSHHPLDLKREGTI
ncbi:hypothetical protein KEM48_007705 [Puccinia striiformis f. sp. tritici PST-130]|nr:hypothetical protein KEM48_007705 [Puccinia striiformis f. sp. tritici PST-130]